MSSMGCLELLKESELNLAQRDLVNTISTSSNVLLMLVEDILELVKIEFEEKESTNDVKSCQVFNFGKELNALKNIITGYASQLSVHLEFHIQEEIENLVVECNQSRVHQVLSNLLTNAVKVSKKGGKVELICNTVNGEHGKDEVTTLCFQVKDYGSGIPKDKIQAIFEPFIQLHNVNESRFPRYVDLKYS